MEGNIGKDVCNVRRQKYKTDFFFKNHIKREARFEKKTPLKYKTAKQKAGRYRRLHI